MEVDVAHQSEQGFIALREEWTSLLSESCADPLFMSWEWQYNWWNTWGNNLGLELYFLAARIDGRLIGLLPLFRDSYSPWPGIRSRRLQFIGNHWRVNDTVRSEYLGPIVNAGYRQTVIQALVKCLLRDSRWDELLICDQIQHSSASVDFSQALTSANCHLHIWEKETSYQVDSEKIFADYLRDLGKNTRLKLYNRRKSLEGLGARHEPIEGRESESGFFSNLNDFHSARWGKPCFSADSLSFHFDFIQSCKDSACTIEVDLSALTNECEILSVLYNLVAGGRVYNIQSGYLENFDKKISLGTLHLGYSIEHCFLDTKMNSFDFLAGRGKNSNYKERLANNETELMTISCVRSSFYTMVLIVYQRMPNILKRCVSRVIKLMSLR